MRGAAHVRAGRRNDVHRRFRLDGGAALLRTTSSHPTHRGPSVCARSSRREARPPARADRPSRPSRLTSFTSPRCSSRSSRALPTVWLGLAQSVRAPPSAASSSGSPAVAILAAGSRGGGFGYLGVGSTRVLGSWPTPSQSPHGAVVRCTARAPRRVRAGTLPTARRAAAAGAGGRPRAPAPTATFTRALWRNQSGVAVRRCVPPPPEPARQWWLAPRARTRRRVCRFGGRLASRTRSRSPPRWGDVSILINLALGLLVACAIRLAGGSSDQALRPPSRAHGSPVLRHYPIGMPSRQAQAGSYSYWWSRAPPMPPRSPERDRVVLLGGGRSPRRLPPPLETAAAGEGAVVVDAMG